MGADRSLLRVWPGWAAKVWWVRSARAVVLAGFIAHVWVLVYWVLIEKQQRAILG
jgi:hypothetical protein